MSNPYMGTARAQQDRYFEAEVLSADPVKLVTMLYRGALEAVAAGRAALAAGNVPERSRQILKAWDILHELRGSLSAEKGGDLSRQLDDLYVYVGQRLMAANTEQSDAPLSEAASILTILAEAWLGVQARESGARSVDVKQPQPVHPRHQPVEIAC